MHAAESKSYWCLVGSLGLARIELAGEADLLGVIDGHVHEGRQMLDLALHVGVP